VGGGPANRTWEPLNHVLPGAADLVRAFHARHPTKPRPKNLADLLGPTPLLDEEYAIRILLSPTSQTRDPGTNENLCHRLELLT
jgi:hypothetical protein